MHHDIHCWNFSFELKAEASLRKPLRISKQIYV